MAEYIEREALLAAYDKAHKGPPGGARKLMEEAPAVDVEPVKRGQWSIRCDPHTDTYTGETDEEYYLECSECKRKVWDVSQDAIIKGDYRKAIADFPYCHCGAKML